MALQIDDHYQDLFSMLNQHGLNEDEFYNAWYRFKLCADSGLLLHGVPASYGGHSDSFYNLCKAYEALGFFSCDPGLVVSLQAHVWGILFPLVLYGSPRQKRDFIPALLDGDAIGGYAITEPDSGCTTTHLKASACREGDYYTINAHKRFIINAPIARYLLVYAYLQNELCAFLVDVEDPGVEFYDAIATEGLVTAPMGDVVLENCHLPAERMLGGPGEGRAIARFTREMERVFPFAGITGFMQWQLEQTSLYVNQKRSGSPSPLSSHESVGHTIANMRMRLDTCRLWVEHCARLKDDNQRITLSSAEAKVYCGEAFLNSAMDSVQLLGAMGLTPQYDILHWVDDALAMKVLSGAAEEHKNLIVRQLGLNQ